MSNPNIVGHNSKRWANALIDSPNSSKYTDLLRDLCATKEARYDTLKALELPTLKSWVMPLDDFISDPEQIIKQVETLASWYQIISLDHKTTFLDIPVIETIDHIKQNYEPDSLLLLSEFLPNRYGGNIIIRESGALIAEYGEGTQADYSARSVTPTHFVLSKFGTDTPLQYSDNTDQTLKQAMYQAIKALYRGGDAIPGYYEFALVNGKNGPQTLKPIFLDAIVGETSFNTKLDHVTTDILPK